MTNVARAESAYTEAADLPPDPPTARASMAFSVNPVTPDPPTARGSMAFSTNPVVISYSPETRQVHSPQVVQTGGDRRTTVPPALPPVKAKVLSVSSPGHPARTEITPAPGYPMLAQPLPTVPAVPSQGPLVPVHVVSGIQQRGLQPRVVQHVAQPTAQFSTISHPPFSMAERWASTQAPQPVMRTSSITYPSGASVNFRELSAAFAPVAAVNASHRSRIIPALESGDLVRQTLQTYAACDREMTGFLSLHNGEIRDFIAAVFQQQGLGPPDENQMYQLYMKFDADRNSVLDARECLCMVDALFRSIFFEGPPAAPMTHKVAALKPPHLPLPSANALGPLQPGSVSIPGLAPPMGLHIPPSTASTTYTSRDITPPCSVGIPPAGACVGPPPLIPPSSQGCPPAWALQQPPRPAPKPPAYQFQHEQRPHLLEVELHELELLPSAPDLEASWYHAVKYCISLHPRSEHPDHIPLPRDPPKATVEGKFLVSKTQAPKKSKLKVGAPSGEDQN